MKVFVEKLKAARCFLLTTAGVTFAFVVVRALCSRRKNSEASQKMYESDRSVAQYLDFHYIPGEKILSQRIASIREAFDFPLRLARQLDVYKGRGRVLDMGCATGGLSFYLSKRFTEVVGIDLSSAFIRVANSLKENNELGYQGVEQGDRTIDRVATVPTGSNPDRCTFLVMDALEVNKSLGSFDAVVAANLLCRVPKPTKLLHSFAELVKPGGLLLLASPYSWWEGATQRNEWIGGKPGDPPSEELVKGALATSFRLLDERSEPFLIKDHSRRYQLSFSHVTVWRRLDDSDSS